MTVKEKIQIKNGYISKPEAMDHSLKIKTKEDRKSYARDFSWILKEK